MIIVRILAGFTLFLLICYVTGNASEQPQKQTTEDQAKRLYSEDAGTRSNAAKRLAAAGPSAIPSLVSVLCDKTRKNFDVAWPVAAKVLGELKAEAAAPCLVEMLMDKYPSIGPVVGKSDETLANVDPAFAALVQIGEPAVPAIRRRLPFLLPEPAIMALRVLRAINTPSAKDAAEAYIKFIEDQSRLANQILRDFGQKPGE